MESVLIVVTLVSLALTIALAVVLARLMRDERRRSEARAAVLREMADAVAREQLLEEPGDELDLPLVADVQPAGDLFVHREPGSAWPRRVAVAAALASLVTVAALALTIDEPIARVAHPDQHATGGGANRRAPRVALAQADAGDR